MTAQWGSTATAATLGLLIRPTGGSKKNQRGATFRERGNPLLCLAALLKKYQSKMLLGAKSLCLQPRRVNAATDSFLYTAIPLRVSQLPLILPRMCKGARTHRSYTNHSPRATAIQKLCDAGLERWMYYDIVST